MTIGLLMDCNKLPPSLLVALGLAGCGPAVEVPPAGTDGSSGGSLEGPMTTACLECPIDTCDDVTTGPCLAEAEVSACLEPWSTTTTDDTTTGPCLGPDVTFINPDTETVGSSGSGTDTDTDTDGSGSGSTTGATADARTERASMLRKLLEGGVLPADLAARLRDRA